MATLGSYSAFLISPANGSFGSEVDLVDKGGWRPFALVAKVTYDFPKPAFRWGNPKTGHPRSALRTFRTDFDLGFGQLV
jgi:hypothetical protein